MQAKTLFITIPSLIAAAMPASVPAQVRISERGILINGRPFFPIGLFCVGWTAEDSPAALADAARLGCNTVHSYWTADIARSTETVRAYLDEAARLGLKVTPTLGDYRTPREAVATGDDAPLREAMKRMIGPLKDHPALLAWYVWDEPNVGVLAAPPEVVKAASDAMKREDPNHPTFFCFTPWHNLDRIDSYGACCDILAVDPYVRAKYMGLVSKSVQAARRAAGAPPPERVEVEAADGSIHIRELVIQGRMIILAANGQQESLRATFRMSDGARPKAVRVVFEQRRVPAEGNAFQDELAPLATHAYEVELGEQ